LEGIGIVRYAVLSSMEHIIDPRTLLVSAPPHAPFWALIDAFDAATNGLENPEASARLDQIEDPVVQPWKTLIAAIRAMYAQDETRCAGLLDLLEETSAPACLKPLFRAWLHTRGSAPAHAALRDLADSPAAVALLFQRLIAGTHPLVLLAEQAEEALRQGMTDHFEGLSFRIMRELQALRRCDGPVLAIRYALRSLRFLEESGYPGNDYFSVVVRALGQGDGFFALGVALLEVDGKAAATAFRGALDADDGHFADAAFRPVLTDLLALLDAQDPAASGIARGRLKNRKPRCSPDQLDLFPQETLHG